jgi:tRNA-modifying protein YgfZ
MTDSFTDPPVRPHDDRASNQVREYAAARSGAAIVPFPGRSLLSAMGRDAVEFLQGMLTQDVARMEVGEVLPACQVDRKGHLLADLLVRRLEDGALLDVPTSRLAMVLDLYRRHRIMERADFEPIPGLEAVLVCGPQASGIARCVERGCWPTGDVPGGGWRVWVDEPQGFIADAVAAGAEPIGMRTLERLRIEAGRPWFGRDMDESNLPQEVRLDEGVSTSKGCYLGQETLARLHFRGHVNRSLYGVRIPGPAPVIGAEVRMDGVPVGRLSSVAGPPANGDSLGLILLRCDLQEEGRQVDVDGREARLESLPFVEARSD